jgi:acetyl-CoA carboxylase carboxyltransferase component
MNNEFNRNEDAMKLSLNEMHRRLDKILRAVVKKAIEKQREKNKLTPRERITYLIDSDKPFTEIGAFAGYEMYAEQAVARPAARWQGVGYVSGRQCVILANDQTVKPGPGFPSPVRRTFGCRR